MFAASGLTADGHGDRSGKLSVEVLRIGANKTPGSNVCLKQMFEGGVGGRR
jgi:hypothetical protein